MQAALATMNPIRVCAGRALVTNGWLAPAA